MARRTFTMVDVTDYAALEIMRLADAPPGGTRWLAGLSLPERAA
jgi:hypothetical protein